MRILPWILVSFVLLWSMRESAPGPRTTTEGGGVELELIFVFVRSSPLLFSCFHPCPHYLINSTILTFTPSSAKQQQKSLALALRPLTVAAASPSAASLPPPFDSTSRRFAKHTSPYYILTCPTLHERNDRSLSLDVDDPRKRVAHPPFPCISCYFAASASRNDRYHKDEHENRSQNPELNPSNVTTLVALTPASPKPDISRSRSLRQCN